MMLSQDPILLPLPGYLILYKTKAGFIRLFSVLSLSLSVVLNTGNKQKLHQKSFGEKSNASATDSWCIRVLCVAMHIKCCCQTI